MPIRVGEWNEWDEILRIMWLHFGGFSALGSSKKYWDHKGSSRNTWPTISMTQERKKRRCYDHNMRSSDIDRATRIIAPKLWPPAHRTTSHQLCILYVPGVDWTYLCLSSQIVILQSYVRLEQRMRLEKTVNGFNLGRPTSHRQQLRDSILTRVPSESVVAWTHI